MKRLLSHITILLLLSVGEILLHTPCVFAEGIRIIPKSAVVKNDSLLLVLQMDLNNVRVNTVTAVSFTPVLKGKHQQTVEFPPVIISGEARFRFERRERALTTKEESPVTPYLVLLDSRKTVSKLVHYQVAVPYASWMQGAQLLLRQDIKDCCDLQVLGVDTLAKKLAVVSGTVQREMPDAVQSSQNQAVLGVKPKPVIRQSKLLLPQKSWKATELDRYASMVSFLVPDPGASGKRRSERITLYFDYPIGKDNIYPDYKNNRNEIDKIEHILKPLLDNGFSTVERIRIEGYSSPDGPYGDNERLAKARSHLFSDYMQRTYKLPASLVEVSSVAEDWEGFAGLLQQANPPYKEATLDIIRRYGIFQGREKQLMDLQGGTPYKDMLQRFFPKLRRIEVVVRYNVRKVEGGEASELIYTHPELLDLEEMYAVAKYYRPGTDQYREVYEIAAFRFPDDAVANINAASAVMLTGDLQSAWHYLQKVESDPRAWNNLGVLTFMEGDAEGAIVWFRKAVGVDPRKARENLQMVEEALRVAR